MPEDDDFRASLRGTKRIYSEMRKQEADPAAVTKTNLSDWKAVVAAANKELARMSKRLKALEERQTVDRTVMKEEMRCELVDREANSARTADRFRVLFERNGGSGRSTLERARWSNTAIECSIGCLCPHPLGINPGTCLLRQKVVVTQAGSSKHPLCSA